MKWIHTLPFLCLVVFENISANEADSNSQRVAVKNSQTATPRPNILFFLVDDMGWQDSSVIFHYDARGKARPSKNQTGKLRITPNMEKLAAQGMKSISAYAYSVCSPTRVSIMTGMNSARHHVTTWTHPDTPQDTGDNGVAHLRSPANWRKAGMDEADVALPKLLKNTGYRTIQLRQGTLRSQFFIRGKSQGDPALISTSQAMARATLVPI